MSAVLLRGNGIDDDSSCGGDWYRCDCGGHRVWGRDPGILDRVGRPGPAAPKGIHLFLEAMAWMILAFANQFELVPLPFFQLRFSLRLGLAIA